jgi:hypothetical protein
VTWISPELQAWLLANETHNGMYRHVLIEENEPDRADGLTSLARLADEAHRDARQRLERLLEISLDPLAGEQPPGWRHYPDALHTSALHGYLGELLAGLIAENFMPHRRSWVVPAFLFRGHQAAHQELERRRQLGGPSRPIPGRTGDDALAFEIDDDDAITSWLWVEAKCTHDHDAGLISAGHEQLSATIRVPVDLMQLVDVLHDSVEPDSERWIGSLRELLFATQPPPRFDMLVYVCGRKPKRKTTWIPTDVPHPKYTGPGPLEAVEVRLDDFDGVLVATYPQHVINRG